MAKGKELAEQAIEALCLWKQVRTTDLPEIKITKQQVIQNGRQLATPKNEFTVTVKEAGKRGPKCGTTNKWEPGEFERLLSNACEKMRKRVPPMPRTQENAANLMECTVKTLKDRLKRLGRTLGSF